MNIGLVLCAHTGKPNKFEHDSKFVRFRVNAAEGYGGAVSTLNVALESVCHRYPNIHF